jgi:hypothetical protein
MSTLLVGTSPIEGKVMKCNVSANPTDLAFEKKLPLLDA